MKTTIELRDELFARAKRHAAAKGVSLRQLVEEGLRKVLDEPTQVRFTLKDRSVGTAKGKNPLAGMSWQELRDEIYGG